MLNYDVGDTKADKLVEAAKVYARLLNFQKMCENLIENG